MLKVRMQQLWKTAHTDFVKTCGSDNKKLALLEILALRQLACEALAQTVNKPVEPARSKLFTR